MRLGMKLLPPVFREYQTKPEYCNKIFKEFGLSTKKSVIINGHMPVKIRKGETPIKANGKLIINGPSISPQLLPSGSSEFKNINHLATVTAGDYDASMLVDGVINTLYSKIDSCEVYFEEKTTVTFTFDSDVNVKAVLVYDSADYLASPDSYELSFAKDKVGKVLFNPLYKYVDEFGYEIKIPTSSSIIQFENIKTSIAWYLAHRRHAINVFHFFDKIICGDMIENGKPNPDIYIEASRQLGFKPDECIALEDSPNGILSAYRAGCLPVMVPDLTQPDAETAGLLYAKCDSLADVINVIEKMI